MKKFFVAAFIAITAMAANAQSWVGGSFGLNFSTPKGGETEISLAISPEYGYNFNDKWAIGIALEEEVSFVGDYDVNVVTLEPFARYTFAKAGIASFFVDGGIGFGCEYTNYEGEMLDNSAWGFSIGFKPGVKLAVTENISLVAKLGFLGYKRFEAPEDYPGAYSYDSFGLGVDADALSFGMYWSF
ncbi:MAG: porin family protein [Muribaculaceae bacterium]|nr:porin family protein [Muribaculaceae bacterium]